MSESAASYVSVLDNQADVDHDQDQDDSLVGQRAFKLPEFIPLLQQRIYVLNPFTRTFLVNWITLLDSIPDLELVSYLPSFLGGLLRFLSDANQDVHTTTRVALDRFLVEIKKIAGIKKGIAESRKSHAESVRKPSFSSARSPLEAKGDDASSIKADGDSLSAHDANEHDETYGGDANSLSSSGVEEDDVDLEEEYIPGQDVQVDHAKILDILLNFLNDSSGMSVKSNIRSHSNSIQKKKYKPPHFAGSRPSSRYVPKIFCLLFLDCSHKSCQHYHTT